MRAALLFALLPLAASCKKDVSESAPPPSTPGVPMDTAMHANLGTTAALQLALVRGDLGAAHSASKDLFNSARIDPLPEPWLVGQVAMRLAAARISDTRDLPAAARATADLGAQCASCHKTAGLGPSFYARLEPAPAAGGPGHMAHHAWASDLMWKGLIGPDHDLFQRGATALAEHALAREGVPAEVTALEATVHQVAGRPIQGDADRRAMYAEIITTCGSCHIKLGISPADNWAETLQGVTPR